MVSMFEHNVQAQHPQSMATYLKYRQFYLFLWPFCCTAVIVAFCIIYLGYGHRVYRGTGYIYQRGQCLRQCGPVPAKAY